MTGGTTLLRLALPAMAVMAVPAAAQTAAPAAAQTADSAAAPAPAARPALPGADPVQKPQGPGEVSREAPVNGVLTLYGNQRCPTDSNGAEVVVCVRRSAAEQFRIPKALRDLKATPENEAWAARLGPTMEAGATGVGSCNAVGFAGQSGCLVRQTRVAKAEAKQREEDATADLDRH